MIARTTMLAAVELLAATEIAAAEVRIVTLGASNTRGYGRLGTSSGVGTSEAYPAQLEAILRARGIEARVSNEGIGGDTTVSMLSRLRSAAPDGPDVVVLQPGDNDGKPSLGTYLISDPHRRAPNIAEMRCQPAVRNIPVVLIDNEWNVAPSPAHRDKDGVQFNAQGHKAIAQ